MLHRFISVFCTIAVLLMFGATSHARANEGVLVLGGTGQLGSEIVKDLVEAGEDVTVFARPTSNRERLAGLDVSYVTGDILSEDDVEAAFKSGPFRVIVDALARDGDVAPEFYVESMMYISKWAVATGVKQVILHGSVGAGLSYPIYPKERWEVMGPTIMAKSMAERHLMESGAPYTIIRHLVLAAYEFKESGNAQLTTDQSNRGLMTRDGLARLTMECLDKISCLNEVFHAHDPEAKVTGRYADTLRSFNALNSSD